MQVDFTQGRSEERDVRRKIWRQRKRPRGRWQADNRGSDEAQSGLVEDFTLDTERIAVLRDRRCRRRRLDSVGYRVLVRVRKKWASKRVAEGVRPKSVEREGGGSKREKEEEEGGRGERGRKKRKREEEEKRERVEK